MVHAWLKFWILFVLSFHCVFGFVYNGSTNLNTIEYITIASTGNATDFGDLINSTAFNVFGAVSNKTRGVFGGSGNKNMCFVTIASTGNATDFADLLSSGGIDHPGAASANHGGLS